MTELKQVKLDLLDPNPFRDGSGGSPAATWVSVEEAYGYDETKLAELMGSFRANGVWAGMIARPVGKRYQLTFGHHRAEAARRVAALGEGPSIIPLIIEDLSDDEMVKRMAAENSEEYGHDFALGVVNAVEAVVKAYGSGLIELTHDPKAPKNSLHSAPSFASLHEGVKTYNAESVARYLGWMVASQDKAQNKVRTALDALELIEKGTLKRTQLKGLGSAQARELVILTSRRIKQEEEKQEVQEAFLEKQRAEAAKQDDKRKVASLTVKIEDLQESSKKAIRQAGLAAASQVKEYFAESKSMAGAIEKTARELKLAEALVKPKEPKKLDLTEVDNYAARIDATLTDEDSRFHKIILLATNTKARKTFNDLEEALLRLSDRAKLRAKELRKVVG